MNYLLINISNNKKNLANINFNNTVEKMKTIGFKGTEIKARFWGLSIGKEDKNFDIFNRLVDGDKILFSNKDKGIFASASIYKKYDYDKNDLKSISAQLWGSENYEHIFQLENFKNNIQTNIENLKAHGLPSSSGILQAPRLVTKSDNPNEWNYLRSILKDGNAKSIKEIRESLNKRISNRTINDKKMAQTLKNRDYSKTGSDRTVISKARREQAADRKYLIDRWTDNSGYFECSICGKVYPIEFMSASHIIRRTNLDDTDRSNPWVLLPMCYLGCDKLFEERVIKFDLDKKSVVINDSEDYGEDLIKFIKENTIKIYDDAYKNVYLEDDEVFNALSEMKDKYSVIVDDIDMPFMKAEKN